MGGQGGVAGSGEGVLIGAVGEHGVVERDASRGEAAAGLCVIHAVDEAHEFAHHVHVIPRRAEGVFCDEPAVGEDDEVEVGGAGCF